MKRLIAALILVLAVLLAWRFSGKSASPTEANPPHFPRSEENAVKPPTASEKLLEGYADPTTPPIEDLKKIHRVVAGYFSVVKDTSRFPIGGNADLAAALRGENANEEIFVPEGHAVFSKDHLLLDRWGSPLVVHPEGWKQLELRSPGPDRQPYTEDDLILSPEGRQR